MKFLLLLFLFGPLTLVKGGEKDDKEKFGQKPTPPRDCVQQCTFDLKGSLEKDLGNKVTESLFRLEIEAVYALTTKNDNFKSFCRGMLELRTCVQNCPFSFLGELIKQSGKIIDFYCVDKYSDILTYLPCMKTVTHDQPCINECHSKYYSSAKALTDRFNHLILLGDTEKTESLFGDTCKYASCTYDCELPKTRQKCGPKTTDLIVEMGSYAFKVYQNLALGTGVIGKIPDSCEDLAKYKVKILPTTTTTVLPVTKKKPTATVVVGPNPNAPIVMVNETNGPTKNGIFLKSNLFISGLLILIVSFVL